MFVSANQERTMNSLTQQQLRLGVQLLAADVLSPLTRAQRQRALTILADGGIIPADWEPPIRAYLADRQVMHQWFFATQDADDRVDFP